MCGEATFSTKPRDVLVDDDPSIVGCHVFGFIVALRLSGVGCVKVRQRSTSENIMTGSSTRL